MPMRLPLQYNNTGWWKTWSRWLNYEGNPVQNIGHGNTMGRYGRY